MQAEKHPPSDRAWRSFRVSLCLIAFILPSFVSKNNGVQTNQNIYQFKNNFISMISKYFHACARHALPLPDTD
jgi:hypothetical protein